MWKSPTFQGPVETRPMVLQVLFFAEPFHSPLTFACRFLVIQARGEARRGKMYLSREETGAITQRRAFNKQRGYIYAALISLSKQMLSRCSSQWEIFLDVKISFIKSTCSHAMDFLGQSFAETVEGLALNCAHCFVSTFSKQKVHVVCNHTAKAARTKCLQTCVRVRSANNIYESHISQHELSRDLATPLYSNGEANCFRLPKPVIPLFTNVFHRGKRKW